MTRVLRVLSLQLFKTRARFAVIILVNADGKQARSTFIFLGWNWLTRFIKNSSCMDALALITGSSRGIGRGIAIELARARRHNLVINYAANEAAALECARLCTEASDKAVEVEVIQGDVSRSADRQRMIDFVREKFGRLDLLVNNAGVAPELRTDLLDAGEESFDRMVQDQP